MSLPIRHAGRRSTLEFREHMVDGIRLELVSRHNTDSWMCVSAHSGDVTLAVWPATLQIDACSETEQGRLIDMTGRPMLDWVDWPLLLALQAATVDSQIAAAGGAEALKALLKAPTIANLLSGAAARVRQHVVASGHTTIREYN